MESRVYRLSGFPKEMALRDGTRVQVRPMEPGDVGALLRFFQRVPVPDRYYLKEDVTSELVIQRWASELDYSRALPLLAWVGREVVADATLHRTRALARHHRGEIRVVVAPEYRGKALGTGLIRELVEIARERGLEILVVELVLDSEEAAVRAVESLGFTSLVRLPGHAKDLEGNPRDIVIMEMRLS